MTGIQVWPSSRSEQPRGADRFYWASLQPSEANAVYRLRSGTVVPPFENPAGSIGVGTFTAGEGNYYNRQQLGGQGCAHFAVGGPSNLSPSISPTFPMDLPSGVGYSSDHQVMIFREVIRWTQNVDGALPAGIGTMHGFTCQFNTQYNVMPIGVITTAAVSGIGLVYQPRTGSMFFFRKRNPAAAVLDLITPAEYNPAAWAVVDHRLFAPTGTEPGRYELWINQQRVRVLSGADANFPIVQAASWKYGALAYLSDNYAGKSGGIRVRYSELITGPITDNVLAYE